MASPNDVAMKDGDSSSKNQPFTLEENINQLNAIDKSAVELMSHTATALGSLTTSASEAPAAGEQSKPAMDAESQKEAFRSATDSFLTTLHDIDVRMKRQIMALEEAGIVNLASTTRQGPNATAQASLRPNGQGAVGNLDVGWLNSRSTKVERDMEAELWERAKKLLEKEGDKLRTN